MDAMRSSFIIVRHTHKKFPFYKFCFNMYFASLFMEQNLLDRTWVYLKEKYNIWAPQKAHKIYLETKSMHWNGLKLVTQIISAYLLYTKFWKFHWESKFSLVHVRCRLLLFGMLRKVSDFDVFLSSWISLVWTLCILGFVNLKRFQKIQIGKSWLTPNHEICQMSRHRGRNSDRNQLAGSSLSKYVLMNWYRVEPW